jgi:hypothetical protein
MGGYIVKKTSPNTVSESNYDARTNYLNVLKQFMAHTNESGQSRRDQNLEDYFQYEKELSQHIQEMLSQCT